MEKTLSWFEIPVTDMQRACEFYGALLLKSLREEAFGQQMLAVFPYDREGGATGGALVKSDRLQPGADGALVYLNAGESLDHLLARVEPAGGRIVVPRTELPPGMGAFAVVGDTEGNRVGWHAMK